MKYQTDERGFIFCTNSKGNGRHFSPHLIKMAFESGKPETYLKGYAPIAPLDDEVELIDVKVKEEVKTAEVVTETVKEPVNVSARDKISAFDFDEGTIKEGKVEIERLLSIGHKKADLQELIKDVQKKGIINYVKEL